MWSIAVAACLVVCMGFACQRGNTCTVATIDDLVFRRSTTRVQALAYTWAIVAGGLSLLNHESSLTLSSYRVVGWTLLGGALLGVGAVVNGSCTTGTICRIGSGEYAFAMTVIGFFAGCAAAPWLLGDQVVDGSKHPVQSATLLHSRIAIAAATVAVALTVVRCVRSGERWRDAIHRPWDPRVASAVIAVLYVITYELHGHFTYTELLGDLARGRDADLAVRVVLLLALLGGSVVGGRTQRGVRPTGPLAPRVVRCLAGGTVMGVGFSLTHASFDGMTFVGQPLLLPLAWTAMAATYTAIVLGIAWLRSPAGARIRSRRGTREMPDEMFSGRSGTEAVEVTAA